jgi:hypothetical protein
MTQFVNMRLMSFWPAFDSSHVGQEWRIGNVVVEATNFHWSAAGAVLTPS